jgi:Rrf2 family protein
MIYSTGCEHAIRALTRLAQQAPDGGFCLLRQIIGPDKLPEHFVGKILQTLVKADILISSKGRNGGFALRVAPDELPLRQIVEAIDGSDKLNGCVLGMRECDEHQACGHHDCWDPVRKSIDQVLDKTMLSDLVICLNKKQHRGRR